MLIISNFDVRYSCLNTIETTSKRNSVYPPKESCRDFKNTKGN